MGVLQTLVFVASHFSGDFLFGNVCGALKSRLNFHGALVLPYQCIRGGPGSWVPWAHMVSSLCTWGSRTWGSRIFGQSRRNVWKPRRTPKTLQTRQTPPQPQTNQQNEFWKHIWVSWGVWKVREQIMRVDWAEFQIIWSRDTSENTPNSFS